MANNKTPPSTPSPEYCIVKSLQIINRELEKIDTYSKSNPEPLERSDSSSLTDYLKTLLLLNKEDREASKGMNWQTKSDEELEQLAQEAFKFIKETPKNEKRKPKNPSKPARGEAKS